MPLIGVATVVVSSPVPVTGSFYQAVQPTSDGGPKWASLHFVANSADMSGAGVAICAAPASGLKFVLTDLIISAGAALSVTLKEETGGAVLGGPYYLPANSVLQITVRSKGIKTTTAVDRILAVASGAGNVTVETWGYTEA